MQEHKTNATGCRPLKCSPGTHGGILPDDAPINTQPQHPEMPSRCAKSGRLSSYYISTTHHNNRRGVRPDSLLARRLSIALTIMPGSWKDIAAKKRAELLDSIPEQWRIPADILPPESQLDVTTFPEKSGWFTAEELEYTNSSATVLLKRLRSGKYSSEQVTKAFCKRAAAAHQLVRRP